MRPGALALALSLAGAGASAQSISQAQMTVCGRPLRFESDGQGGIALVGLDSGRIVLGAGRVEVERAEAPGAQALVVRLIRTDSSPGRGVVVHCGNGAPPRVVWQGSIAWRGEDVGARVRDDVRAVWGLMGRTILHGHRREDLRLCGAGEGFVDGETLDIATGRWVPGVVDPRAVLPQRAAPQRVTATAGSAPGVLQPSEVGHVQHVGEAGTTERHESLRESAAVAPGDWVHLGLRSGGVALRALQIEVPRGGALPRRWLVGAEPDGVRLEVEVPDALARGAQDRAVWVDVPLPQGIQPQCLAVIPRDVRPGQRVGRLALRSALDESPDAAVASLLERADRPDGDDAVAVLSTLGPRGRGALAEALPRMTVPGARRAIRTLAGATEAPVLTALAGALAREELRDAAMSALQRAGAEALAPLAEMARTEPSAVRALATLRVPAADRLRALSQALDADGDAWRAVRVEIAALVTAAARDGSLPRWVASLPPAGTASARALRVAAETLAPDDPAAPALAEAARARWSGADDFALRYRLLSALPGDDAGRALAEEVLRDDPDVDLRAEAARALGRARRSGSALRAALEDRAPRVRAAAARALAQDAGATGALRAVLREDAWPSVRVAAAEALGGRAESAEALLRATEDRSFVVVSAALAALARTPGDGISARLLAFADDGRRNPALRREAVDALGQRCDRAVIDGIERLAETESDPSLPRYEQEIGESALAALARLDAERARAFLTRMGSNAAAAGAVERAIRAGCSAR